MERCEDQQAHSSKRIEAFSANFHAEEDVSFIRNNKGCTMAQVLTVDFGTPSYEFIINICTYLIF
jgi:hypothetical protein